jgi:gas vesicle protein
MEERCSRIGSGAVLLLAGALVGAGVALLLAPQSGRATRSDIARHARRTRRKAGRTVEELAGNVAELVDRIGEKSGEILDRGRELSHDARKELLAALEAGRDRLEAERARISGRIG